MRRSRLLVLSVGVLISSAGHAAIHWDRCSGYERCTVTTEGGEVWVVETDFGPSGGTSSEHGVLALALTSTSLEFENGTSAGTMTVQHAGGTVQVTPGTPVAIPVGDYTLDMDFTGSAPGEVMTVRVFAEPRPPSDVSEPVLFMSTVYDFDGAVNGVPSSVSTVSPVVGGPIVGNPALIAGQSLSVEFLFDARGFRMVPALRPAGIALLVVLLMAATFVALKRNAVRSDAPDGGKRRV